MITCTSEMSGSASSSIRCIDQIPANPSRSVPLNTRKRLRAHQSIQREITLHSPFGVHAQLPVGESLAVLQRHDGHLPGSTAFQLRLPFVNTVTLVAEFADHAHGAHAH